MIELRHDDRRGVCAGTFMDKLDDSTKSLLGDAFRNVDDYLWQATRSTKPIVTAAIAKLLDLPADRDSVSTMRLVSAMTADQWAAHGLAMLIPPENVRWMGKKSGVFLDLTGADEIATTVRAAGLDFNAGKRYLDFGCASGRTVRTMQLAFPECEWHGADPVTETIGWARENLPKISFIASPQRPPIPYADSYFDGVYAISVWSHFREDVALEWFTEMHRIIAPNGFLAFTAPGYTKAANQLRGKPEILPKIERRIQRLQKTGYAFGSTHKPEGPLDNQFWGSTELTLTWVVKNLVGPWSLRKLVPAGNRSQQDIYILQRV